MCSLPEIEIFFSIGKAPFGAIAGLFILALKVIVQPPKNSNTHLKLHFFSIFRALC